jgi:ABC-type Fe3+ transport system permease subunit
MSLPFAGGGFLALFAVILGLIALVSVFRLMGASRRAFADDAKGQRARQDLVQRERARIGFLALAIGFVLACASVFYVLSNIQ